MRKIYSKFTKERVAEYQIETEIYLDRGQKFIQKRALYNEGIPHIQRMYEYYKKNEDKGLLCSSELISENTIRLEFIQGKSMLDKMIECLEKKDVLLFEKIIDDYKKIICKLYNNKCNYTEVIEQEIVDINIDMSFDNIICCSDGKYYITDYEWISKEKEKIKFAVFRAVYAFYIKYSVLVDALYKKDEYFSIFGITKEEISIYLNKNDEFNKIVFDSTRSYGSLLSKYKKKIYDVNKNFSMTDLFSQIYFAINEGEYSEQNSIKYKLNDNHIEIIVNISDQIDKDLYYLRIDPLNIPVLINNFKVWYEEEGSEQIIEDFLSNSIIVDGKMLFYNRDPQIIFAELKRDIIYHICFDIVNISVGESFKGIDVENFFDEIKREKSDLSYYIEEVKRLQKDLESLNEKLVEDRYIISKYEQEIMMLEHKIIEEELEKEVINKDKEYFKYMSNQLRERLTETTVKCKLYDINNFQN